MRVRIERYGGVIGKAAAGERDVAELTPAQRKALDDLVRAPPSPARSPGADRFHYKIVLTEETGRQEFEVPEDRMPDALASIPRIEL
jgi:hypothetical protein